MLEYFLIVALILFLLGIYTCLTRTNAIAILMGVELILNAAALNFVAFSHFGSGSIEGHIMALFIIVLAAAEAVVALALLFAIFKHTRGVSTNELVNLKE